MSDDSENPSGPASSQGSAQNGVPPLRRINQSGGPVLEPSDNLSDPIPRSIDFVASLNPVAALICALISALSMFAMAREQALSVQATTQLLGWIKVALVVAWAACAYLGFISSSMFRQSYVWLSVFNLSVSAAVLIRQLMAGALTGNSIVATAVALYLVACIPLLYFVAR